MPPNAAAAAVYYDEAHAPGVGWRFEAEVQRAVDLLLERPEIGAEADPVLRKFVRGGARAGQLWR